MKFEDLDEQALYSAYRHKFSKGRRRVVLYRKYTRALTFLFFSSKGRR